MACHHHCSVILLIFVVTTILVVAVTQVHSSNFCFDELPEILPKKHFVVDGKIQNIILEGCEEDAHASQRFLNWLFKFLVGEIMGYNNITMATDCVAPNNYDTILSRVSGCNNVSCTEMLSIPEVTINLETWLDTPLSLDPWLDTGQLSDVGALGISSRYGWYVSSTLVNYLWQNEGIVADHWRGLQAQAMVNNLLIPASQLEEWTTVSSRTSSREYYCERDGCEKGVYYPLWCRKPPQTPKVISSDAKTALTSCATLLANYPEDSFNSLVGQITNLYLPVIVAWVGPNLKTIIKQRENNQQYSMFHNWQPNDIAAAGLYSRIAFPTCIGDGSDDQTYEGCDYPFHTIEKVLWRGVGSNAPDLYRFVMKVNMSEYNMENILKDYYSTTLTMADFTCSWIQSNRNLWWPWIPGRTETKPINIQTISHKQGNHYHQPCFKFRF